MLVLSDTALNTAYSPQPCRLCNPRLCTEYLQAELNAPIAIQICRMPCQESWSDLLSAFLGAIALTLSASTVITATQNAASAPTASGCIVRLVSKDRLCNVVCPQRCD